MKIVSCFLVLTFAVYLDLIDGSSLRRGRTGSHDDTPPPRSDWITVETHGHVVEVKKDFITGNNLGIRLPGKEGAAIRLHEGNVFRVNVRAHDVKFIVQINPFDGEWLAVALLSPEFEYLPVLPRT